MALIGGSMTGSSPSPLVLSELWLPFPGGRCRSVVAWCCWCDNGCIHSTQAAPRLCVRSWWRLVHLDLMPVSSMGVCEMETRRSCRHRVLILVRSEDAWRLYLFRIFIETCIFGPFMYNQAAPIHLFLKAAFCCSDCVSQTLFSASLRWRRGDGSAAAAARPEAPTACRRTRRGARTAPDRGPHGAPRGFHAGF